MKQKMMSKKVSYDEMMDNMQNYNPKYSPESEPIGANSDIDADATFNVGVQNALEKKETMNLKAAIEDKFGSPFPIMPEDKHSKSYKIKWYAAMRAYAIYSGLFGSGQSLSRLAERGGFHEKEMDEFYPEWRNYIISKP